MIVDDEIDQLQTLRRGLRTMGYAVVTARSTDEALAEISRQGEAIDVVLSDYQLPGKNGAVLFWELRSHNNQVPFVFMTGYADTQPGGRVAWAEGDGFIEKPCTLEQIIACLEAAVKRKQENTARK